MSIHINVQNSPACCYYCTFTQCIYSIYNVLPLPIFAQVEERVRLRFTVCYTCITMRVTNKEPWTFVVWQFFAKISCLQCFKTTIREQWERKPPACTVKLRRTEPNGVCYTSGTLLTLILPLAVWQQDEARSECRCLLKWMPFAYALTFYCVDLCRANFLRFLAEDWKEESLCLWIYK